MVLPVVPRQMKHNPGMLERILERPSVENSLASGGSRKASLASDLPIAEEPKARVNGSSQTHYLRSAFLDVRLQDSPTGSEVQHRSCQKMGQQASLTLWQILTSSIGSQPTRQISEGCFYFHKGSCIRTTML